MENLKNIKVIAFYLPQFHPFIENDNWWGKGFTEWSNVCKAKPLFRNHYQPKLPTDLGFYDLRLSETREAQAALAKEAGIYGFCYWHYWFNGQELMERPFYEVVQSGKPDFPYCIGWANESWYSKMWNKDGTTSISHSKLLIEQTYSIDDDIRHFNKLLPIFRTNRYIKVDGAPLVFIHRPTLLPQHVIDIWNDLARKNGFPGIHFVGRVTKETTYKELKAKGYNAVTFGRLGDSAYYESMIQKICRKFVNLIFRNGCNVVDYARDMMCYIDPETDAKDDVYPAIYPNWDHSPRSGKRSLILNNCTPELFSKHVRMVLDMIRHKSPDHQICFLKSWNEWGEGNYIEPDIKYGRRYIDVLSEILNSDK